MQKNDENDENDERDWKIAVFMPTTRMRINDKRLVHFAAKKGAKNASKSGFLGSKNGFLGGQKWLFWGSPDGFFAIKIAMRCFKCGTCHIP